jgi:hypothetical protein
MLQQPKASDNNESLPPLSLQGKRMKQVPELGDSSCLEKGLKEPSERDAVIHATPDLALFYPSALFPCCHWLNPARS